MEAQDRSPQPGKEMMEGMAAAVCETLSGEQKVVKQLFLGAQEMGNIHGNLWADSLEQTKRSFALFSLIPEHAVSRSWGGQKHAGSRRKNCGR